MGDPREGVSESGTIRTGADRARVSDVFRPVHEAAVAMTLDCDAAASIHAYGSVVTGQAIVGVSDVDLLTIGLRPADAHRIAAALSARFDGICRGVEIGAAQRGDVVGDGDEAYGNRVFLRHYCVLLGGPDDHRPQQDFPADRRAARGFNGDIARHARRWRDALDAGERPATVAHAMARKTLLAVAGLVSIHDDTWTTDRETAAARWSEVVPEHRAGLARLVAWTSPWVHTTNEPSSESVRRTLDDTVDAVAAAFEERIGLWSAPT